MRQLKPAELTFTIVQCWTVTRLPISERHPRTNSVPLRVIVGGLIATGASGGRG